MYFKEIQLSNFRNYEEERIVFHPKINIITGNNAQGKTNLIEGLYIMSLGKSFRTNKDSDMIGFNKEYARVKTISVKDETEITVEINILPGKKNIKINGVSKLKNIDLLENIYTVIFSPEDLKIVKDEPEKRRKFMDRELCQLRPVYYKTLGKYKKILQQRNALLKQDKIDINMLEVWDSELSKYGSIIIKYRKEFIKKINVISNKIHKSLTNGKEDILLHYECNIDNTSSVEVDKIKNQFQDILKAGRSGDIMRRTTGKGPHKDDIKISVDGIDIRNFGSQGQQRTAALSLKLAELQLIYEDTNVRPVLLLDDVLSELDIFRQQYLIDTFHNNQILITTTEISDQLKSKLGDFNIYRVEKGKVKKI